MSDNNKRPDLVINRVPLKTNIEFKAFAAEEFSSSDGIGDYGMALKFIWDFYKGECRDIRLTQLMIQIDSLQKRIDMLETVIMEHINNEGHKTIKHYDEEEDIEEVETFIDGSQIKR